MGGCNVRGYLRIPKVPGHLELMAGGGDQILVPAMTNTSHLVNHLSFKDPGSLTGWRLWSALPSDLSRMAAPLDGRQFVAESAGQVQEHHLGLVSAATSWGTSYQFVHFGRQARAGAGEVPQVRFHFDIEPFRHPGRVCAETLVRVYDVA